MVDDCSSDGSAETAEQLGGETRAAGESGARHGSERRDGVPTGLTWSGSSTPTTGGCRRRFSASSRTSRTPRGRVRALPERDRLGARDDPAGLLVPDAVFGDLGGVMPLSGLFRRSLVEELGGFGSQDLSEDLDLLIPREVGARIDVLGEQLVVRRIHDANWTRQFGSLAPGVLQGVREHLRRSRETH